MGGFVYLMASKKRGTIYVGVTSDIARRVWEHKNDLLPGFTKTYQVHDLVYYEVGDSIEGCIQRERAIKHWPRRWKVELIESRNPEWDDLYPTLI
jgi:putative endonuclease